MTFLFIIMEKFRIIEGVLEQTELQKTLTASVY